MNIVVNIIKNSKSVLSLSTTSEHLFYDNWLPDVVIDLLNNLDTNNGQVNTASLKYLKTAKSEEGEIITIDLDKKEVRLPANIFRIISPEKVEEENEAYAIKKEGHNFILMNLEPQEGEKDSYILEAKEMNYLQEKMSKVFPLEKAKEILASMLQDAESYKRPTLLENGMVYVANLN